MPSSSVEYCYFCGAPATSREHVPPKCIFPEKKDSGVKEDLRKSLLTVPSCHVHNLSKSTDDEYLLAILSMNCDNNEIGRTQATTKLARALLRSDGLKLAALNNPVRRHIYDPSRRLILETAALTVDPERLKRCFDHIGRGLYWHHFNQKRFTGQISAHIESLVNPGNDLFGEFNHPQRRLRELASHAFSSIQKIGANPSIFYYQVNHNVIELYPAMRLVFYEGSCITLVFG